MRRSPRTRKGFSAARRRAILDTASFSSFSVQANGQPFQQPGDGGGPCMDAGGRLVGTGNFDGGGSWVDATAFTRRWEG